MKNIRIIAASLCTMVIVVHADKGCQYPTNEDFIYNLRPFVEEGNTKGIAELTVQLSTLKKTKSVFDFDACTKNYVDRVYRNIVDNRDEKSLKLIAPFMLEYGQKFLEAPVDAFYKRQIMRARWEVNTASQVPGVMVTEIKRNKAHKIARAWPLLPHATQKRIKEEAKQYYADNCGKVYSDDCHDFRLKLEFIDSLHYAFKKMCKIMPQELKELEAEKQAALKEQLAAYEKALSEQSKQAEAEQQSEVVADNVTNSGEQAAALAESAPAASEVSTNE